MIGEEFETRSKGNNIGIVLALVLAKALRASSLCNGFSLLFSFDFPVVLYTFYTILGSSIVLTIFQRPWQARKTINPNLYLRIIAYSVLLVLNILFWNIGLKYYGPTRAILSSDYADAALSFIFTAFFPTKGKSSKAEKTRGTLIVILAYLLLFWTEPSYSTNFINQHASVLGSIASGPPSIPGEARYFQLGFISIPESKVGGVCLFIAICLSIIRKNFLRHLQNSGYPEIGTKRLYSVSMVIGTILMTPFGLFSAFTATTPLSIFNGAVFFGIAAVVLFGIVGDFYMESFAHQQLDMSYATKASIITSFIVASFCESIWGYSNLTFITTLCFVLILWGMHFIYQKQSSSALPVYGTQGALQAADIFSSAFIKMFFQQVLQSYESRRIFGYLCVNLTFMFVEAFYGWYTNSLGLISDACHMLFDCTALFIGLIASVISQRPSNKVFSFGYGRIEVVSGFVNAVFLMFIAITVLLESAERFFHPQEVLTDKLLLVSFMGLCVNLVGVAAFHDLHGGSGDHGGHSHSHGHGHDHGHEKEEAHNSNLFGVYLHIVADALGSVGVIVSTLLIIWKGWTIADPICSFCISALIFVSVIPLLKSSATILLQCTPPEIDEKMEKCLKLVTRVEGVVSHNNSHFWRLSKDMVVGSIQIQVANEASEQKILAEVQSIFKKKGKIKNMTVEIVK